MQGRALVLSGGGAPGAYEAGVVCALAERERFDVVCGTSIGALNAALYAQDAVVTLAELWHSIAARNVLVPVPPVAAAVRVYDDVSALLRDSTLRRIAGALRVPVDVAALFPLQRFTTLLGALESGPVSALLTAELDVARLARSIIISATNITRTSSDAFYRFVGPDASERGATFAAKQDAAHVLDETNYRAAVQASAAIPGAFAPVVVRTGAASDEYVDGGVANDTPVGQAIDAGADAITVVFTTPSPALATPMRAENLVAVALESFAVIQARLLEADLRSAERRNRALAAGAQITGRQVSLRTIRPSVALAVPFLAFDDQARLDAAFAQGLRDGRAASA